MTKEEFFKDLFDREVNAGCYNIKLNGLTLYQFIKRDFRTYVAHCHGHEIGFSMPSSARWEHRKSLIKSLFQIATVLIRRQKFDIFIYSFPRTEKMMGQYVEKFTDPIIDYSNIKKSYIIFEPDYCGIHRQPRFHNNSVVYADAIAWLANRIAKYKMKKKGLIIHKWEELKSTLEKAFPETNLSNTNYLLYIIQGFYTVKIYQYIFRHLGVNYLISPSRPSHLFLIPAAKIEKVKVYELQHGVCYENTHRTYGGYMEPLFTPDKFLSFGEIKNATLYGIDQKDVVNIGWAFSYYIAKSFNKCIKTKKGVLVISEGVIKEIQEKMLNALFLLADANKEIHFYYRPHPDEYLSFQQIALISEHSNISIDDKTENLMLVMNSFTHILGCNSSGMYDALDMRKKVGKLSMCGLIPLYSEQGDQKYFYEISDESSFLYFVSNSINEKPYREHYSVFNEDLLNRLIQ